MECCSKHKKYTAKRRPICGCQYCETKYALVSHFRDLVVSLDVSGADIKDTSALIRDVTLVTKRFFKSKQDSHR